MSRSGQLLSAALLRPVNLLALGMGLILSLTYAPWWMFPLSLVAYAAMVVLTLRDPAFVRRATGAPSANAGAPLDWRAIRRQLGPGAWSAPIDRIATAERTLGSELAQAPENARAVLASTLEQVRSAAGLGVELARRLRTLDHALVNYAGMNADRSRSEAEDKRRRAAAATDESARRALLDAATALDESARTADSLRQTRERTAAQLESLSAMLESITVRGVRLRVGSDAASDDVGQTLGAEMDAVRETLGVLESIDEPVAGATRP